jgi:hypothetical protein
MLCRELYGQLCRLQSEKENSSAVAITPLPKDFVTLLLCLDSYIRWMEGRCRIIEIAVRRPAIGVSGTGDGA